MVKSISVFAAALLAVGVAQAQTTGTQFGLKAGVNSSVLDGTINTGAEPKTGFLVGGFVRWRPVAHFALQPELVYSQQGCDSRISIARNLELKSKIKLNYLNVPILAKVYLGKVFFVQAGPQFGFLLSGRQVGQTGVTYSSTTNVTYTTADVDVKKDYKNDVSLCGGLGADLPMGLSIAARINYGLNDIDQNPITRRIRDTDSRIGGLYNRVVEFSLGYAFGSK